MTLSLVLALASSLFIGVGEALGSQFVKGERAESVTTVYFLAGVPLTLMLLPFVASTWTKVDMGLGLVSGFFNGLALLLLYRAYELVPVGMAIPFAGVQSAVIPVVYSVFVDGEILSSFTTAGIVVGVVALALVSFDPTPSMEMLRGLRFAVLAGLCFGVMVTVLGKTSQASGLWPLLPQRALGCLVCGYAAKRGGRILPSRRMVPRVFFIGLLGAAGAATFVVAAQRGSLSEVSVAGAQYPAIAVIGAWLFFRTRIRWWQVLGIVAAAVAVSFIALG